MPSKKSRRLRLMGKNRSRRIRKQRGGADCNDIHDMPSGFHVFCDVISTEEEEEIMKAIESDSCGIFINASKKNHGTRECRITLDTMPDYFKGTCIEDLLTQKAISLTGKIKEVKHTMEELERLNGKPFNANHFLINTYITNVGIAPHVNSEDYGPIILGISLGGDCEFILRSTTSDETHKYTVPRRSIYIMSGPSRYDFTHEIPKLRKDTKRISITIRDSAPSTSTEITPAGGAGDTTSIRRNGNRYNNNDYNFM